MKSVIILPALLIILFAAAPLPAQTSFTVDQAVSLALKNNSSILQNNITIEGLKRKKGKSLNGLSPSLSVGAGVAYPNDPVTYDHTAYWMANVTFSFSAAIASDVMKARINYEAGLISQEALLNDIELAVRKSFYGLLYGRINIELQKRNLDSAYSRYEQTLAKYRAGRIPELDVLAAKVSWENLKPELAAAESAYTGDLASFKLLIGAEQNEDIALSGSLEEVLNLKQITTEGIAAKSNKVRTIEKSLELARADRTEAQLGTYSPRVSLTAAYQPGKGYDPVNAAVPESKWEDTGSISAAVTVPLDGVLPWSQANETISSANDEVRIAEMKLNEAKSSAAITADSLLRRIAQSQSAISARRENAAVAERSYAMMSEAYRYGTKDLLSIEQSADALYQAKASLMSEAYTLICAILDLENQIGVPFGSLGK